jgi:hypothetical protein
MRGDVSMIKDPFMTEEDIDRCRLLKDTMKENILKRLRQQEWDTVYKKLVDMGMTFVPNDSGRNEYFVNSKGERVDDDGNTVDPSKPRTVDIIGRNSFNSPWVQSQLDLL